MASRKDSKGRVLRPGESERTDGRYHYSYLNASGKRRYVYAKTLLELRELEQQIERDRMDGIDSGAGQITLNELFDKLMKLKCVRESTSDNYNRMWASNVRESNLGNAKIADIRPIHVKTFYADLSEKGLKRNSIKLLHGLIFAAFELAVDSDYVRKNPAKNGMKGLKADSDERQPLSESQLKSLMEFCEGSAIYSVHVPFLVVAVGTCLRCGELTGLTWSDINMKARTITIDHQLIYKNLGDGCKFHISKPKTSAGVRTIPMTEAVHRALVELRKQDLILGRRCNVEVDGYSDFVFVSGNGQPLATNSINSFLVNMEKKYNEVHSDEPVPHLSAHVLRHTGCTLLAEAGMDVKALQDLMGHSDASVTLNVYNHSSFERTEREIQRIGDVIAM